MNALLKIDNLNVTFAEQGRVTNQPLRGISLEIGEGEILGVVGETGCGKSLTGLAVLGLLPAGGTPSGRILVDGREQDLTKPSPLRGSDISIVFQNPGTAFNPVFSIGSQMHDVLKRHRNLDRKQRRERILRYLEQVGLPDPERVADSYAHELSGGMLQRAMIALALVCEPRLLILDEPTTALDVTVAKQILDLVLSLREQFGFGVMLISHNLGVVREICDRVAVLYAGRVIETGAADDLLTRPQHPYTKGLMNALPGRHERGERLEAIVGQVPARLVNVTGCAFAERCPIAIEACLTTDPKAVAVESSGSSEHTAECIRIGEQEELS